MQTITYDTTSDRPRPILIDGPSSVSFSSSMTSVRVADVSNCRTTFLYGFGYDGQGTPRPPLLPGSSLGPVLGAMDCLLADPRAGWHEFWSLLISHSACERLWRSAAERALARTRSPIEWSDDIVSSARLQLALQLQSNQDVRGWMAAVRDHFQIWLWVVAENRCLEAVRSRHNEELDRRSRGNLRRCYPMAVYKAPDGLSREEEASLVNDLDSLPCRRESGTDWRLDLDVLLSSFPERTRQVLLLRSQNATWAEVAATLGINFEQARWSLMAYARELREVFSAYH